MNTTLFSMKRLFLLTLIVVITGTNCGKDDEPARIEMELINSYTEQPAKVRLFFKANLGDDNLFTTLRPADFDIYEDGSLISSLESQAQVQNESGNFIFSTILLLDLSGSVLNDSELPRVKDAAKTFISSVMPRESSSAFGTKEMAIYWFDGEENIHALSDFSYDVAFLTDRIDSINKNISSDNSTNLNGAVIQGVSVIESRLNENKLKPQTSTAGSLVIFTDGTDQAGRVSTNDARDAVNSIGSEYSVFTIGLGGEIDQGTLERFGKDGFELAENSFDLNSSFLTIAERLESEANSFYVLEYCSPKRSGKHKLELRANFENRFGSFTTEFNAEDFTGGCVIN